MIWSNFHKLMWLAPFGFVPEYFVPFSWLRTTYMLQGDSEVYEIQWYWTKHMRCVQNTGSIHGVQVGCMANNSLHGIVLHHFQQQENGLKLYKVDLEQDNGLRQHLLEDRYMLQVPGVLQQKTDSIIWHAVYPGAKIYSTHHTCVCDHRQVANWTSLPTENLGSRKKEKTEQNTCQTHVWQINTTSLQFFL